MSNQNKEVKLVVASPITRQEELEQKLVAAVARIVARYFQAGGKGFKKINIDDLFKQALKQGVLLHVGDNLELGASLLNSTVGYVKSIKHLEQAGLKIQAQKNERAKIAGRVA